MEISEILSQSVKTLKLGGVLIYPTETVWGIGCDATNRVAVEKILRIKKRANQKGFIVLVNSVSMLESLGVKVSDKLLQYMQMETRPLSVVYDHVTGLAPNVYHSDKSIAIRITSHFFCKQLIATFKSPIVSTSANMSGCSSPMSFNEISNNILKKCNYIVPLRSQNASDIPSKVVKFTNSGQIKIIRE